MKLKLIITFFLALISTFIYSQTIQDSYTKINTDSIENKSLEELNSLFQKSYGQNNKALAKVYNIALVRKSLSLQKKESITLSYYNLSWLESETGNYPLALQHIDSALQFLPDESDDRGDYYLQKAALHSYLQEKEKAIKTYTKTAEFAKKKNDSVLALRVNYSIALTRINFGDYHNVTHILTQTSSEYLNYYEKTKNKNYLSDYCASLMSLGKVYTLKKRYDMAIGVYEKGLALSEAENLKIYKSYFLAGLGNVYSLKNKNTKALEYLNKAEELSIALNRQDLIPFVYLHKGRAFYNQKKYTEASHNLKKITDKKEETTQKAIELQEAYAILANCYSELKAYKKAKAMHQAYVAIDLKNDQRKIKLMNTFFEKYKLKDIIDKIDSLEGEVTENKEKSYLYFVLFSLASLLLCSALFIFWNRRKRYKQRFEELMLQIKDSETNSKQNEVISTPISDNKVSEIFEKLAVFEKEYMFLDSAFTLSTTAKKLNTNSTYLSKIINTYKKQTFTEYITKLRIDYAINELQKNKKLRSYKIQSIAEEVGFNRAQSFSKAFKKATGIYPSYFIKKVISEEKKTISTD